MSSSWNFSAQAESRYEGSEPSQAGALQFPSWNRADNTDNMYVKNSKFLTYFPILCLYHDSNQFHAHLNEFM